MPASIPQVSLEESTVRDYFTLLKPGVMALVVFTGFIGMAMAPGQLHPLLQLVTVLCIALGSGAGAVINMWYDRDIDLLMRRTQRRPLPSGRVAPEDALFLGLFLAIASVGLLGLAVGWVAAGLLAFAIWFYAYVYTMALKRHTPQNIVIGGAAGAFPPVIGWLAVSPHFAWDPVFYFLITFFWTPPHFWALALFRHEDYIAANVPMLPVTAGRHVTQHHILSYSLALLAISLLPSLAGTSGWIYGVCALMLGIYFVFLAWRLLRHDTPHHAMAMFKYSILYLFLIFSLLLLDKMIDRHLVFQLAERRSIIH